MEASSGKEAILKNVRKALIHSTDIPYPGIEKTDFSFDGTNQDLALLFAERFSSLLGKFSFCESEQDLYNQINALVEEREWTEVYCSDENIKSSSKTSNGTSLQEPIIFLCDSNVATASLDNNSGLFLNNFSSISFGDNASKKENEVPDNWDFIYSLLFVSVLRFKILISIF